MFDGRQKKETLRKREKGNEGFSVVKAVELKKKDERIKKGGRKERT